MRCERMPLEEEVESKDFFGKTKTEKGYLWRGHITIHMKKLPKGMTIRNLYDDEGEDYFDGEAAIRQKRERQEKATADGGDVKGNGAVNENESADVGDGAEAAAETVDSGKTADKPKEESLTETQVYELELVISKENAADKSKEMTKAILSKMRNSPNAFSSAQVLRE